MDLWPEKPTYEFDSNYYSEKFKEKREALGAAPWETAMNGFHANYLQGICQGRNWRLKREERVTLDETGATRWACRLTVYGTQLFLENPKQDEAREFIGGHEKSAAAAFEDAAFKAFALLNDLTNNLNKERLPRYYDSRERQGRRAGWDSSASSDEGSSRGSSTSSMRPRSKKQYNARDCS